MCRGWDIAPSEVWGMTVSEVLHEYEWRRPHAKTDYAGGMTEADLEEIQRESAALREKVRARRNGTASD